MRKNPDIFHFATETRANCLRRWVLKDDVKLTEMSIHCKQSGRFFGKITEKITYGPRMNQYHRRDALNFNNLVPNRRGESYQPNSKKVTNVKLLTFLILL
jgi:hypothetical protein